MRVLGIDPGTRIAGYGVVEVRQGRLVGIAAGAWHLGKDLTLAARLAALAIEFRRVMETFTPTHLCIELAFVAENVRSALFLGHARGVILSEAYQRGLAIAEMSATEAKKTITNYGRADKALVAKMMGETLGVSLADLPYDATDALGLAYAHALTLRMVHGAQTDVLKEWQGLAKSAPRCGKKRSSRHGFEALLKQR